MNQRNCIKLCVKNEIKYARTFVESSVSRTQVHLWYNRFKKGREAVNDDDRAGRPSTSTKKRLEQCRK